MSNPSLNPESRFTPNAEAVAAKVIDGEAIIMNLTNGVYYSMDGVGGLVWSLIEAGKSLEEMIRAVTAGYDTSRAQAEADIRSLLSQLVEEAVVVPAREPASNTPSAPVPQSRLPYSSPLLNVYRDMGDLLALDPPGPGVEDIPWKE